MGSLAGHDIGTLMLEDRPVTDRSMTRIRPFRAMTGAICAAILAAILAASALPAPALAQTAADFRQRQNDLVELASVFGELHHIRRLCEPRREGDVWRERMKRLVELEQPAFEAREEMVKRFNAGYQNAGGHFRHCDRRARDHAAGRASFAQTLVDRLSAPLEEEEAANISGPLIVTIPPDEN